MANIAAETRSAGKDRRVAWSFALVTTLLVTVAGLVAAVQQCVLKYLWDQSAHARTIGGVLSVLLGVAGIYLPRLLFRHKRRFLSLRPSRQWLLAIGGPLVYVLALALCTEASLQSTTLILPRPFTPKAVVVYEPANVRVEFRGGWRENLESSYSGVNMRKADDQFSSHLYQGFLRHPRRKTVTIIGGVKQMDDGRIQFIVDVDATESVRFSADNLDNVEIRRDGQRIGELDSQSGKFQLTITGRPRKDTPGAAADGRRHVGFREIAAHCGGPG